MKYIVYKTTNLINGKFYIGVHRVGSSRKHYLGSGILLVKAIKKYGIVNFKRETIKECNSKEEAFYLERELITREFINTNQCYNLALGGCGGDLGEVSNSKKRGDGNWTRKVSKENTPAFGRVKDKHPLYGKTAKDYMTESGRKSLSEKTKNRQLGSKNSAARRVIDTQTGKIYDTIKSAAEELGINYSTLCAQINGRLKSSKRFMYVD